MGDTGRAGGRSMLAALAHLFWSNVVFAKKIYVRRRVRRNTENFWRAYLRTLSVQRYGACEDF